MIKKRYLFLILIVCLFAVSAVSGAEIGNDTNMVVNSGDSGLMAESVNEDVLAVSLNEEEIQGSADNGTFTDLQKKINGADEGSTIVLENDYIYNSGFSTGGITINKNLIIDGNGHVIDALGESRIFYITAPTVTLNNITFKNGYSDDSSGGAIYFSGGASNSNISGVFINNTASYSGGAIYFSYYSVFDSSISGVFINNTAFYGYGGAIYFSGGASNSNISGEFIDNTASSYGGAIYFSGGASNSSISGEFINNTASSYGGAIYFKSVSDSSISGEFINNAASDYGGGAIHFDYGVFNSCIFGEFIGNTASAGGAIRFYGSVSNSSISGVFINNTATNAGGSICFSGGISNSSISGEFIGNTASYGGAIYSNYYSVSDSIIFGEFIGNTASYGGAIHFDYSVFNSCICGEFINNTATKNNTATNGGAIYFKNVSDSSIFGEFIGNAAYDGGAIYFKSVSDSSISGEFINNNGGAISGSFSNSNISGEFINNNGGAISGSFSNSNISGEFINNTAYAGGGAISGSFSNSNISAEFINNTASWNGGAISFGSVFNSCISGEFINNTAFYGHGGAIYFGYSSSFSESTISGEFINNTASSYGGAIYFQIVSDSNVSGEFINNTASGDGGAIYFQSVSGSSISGEFIGNTAYDGAAICFIGGVSDSGISGEFINNAAGRGAIYFRSSVSGSSISGEFIGNTAYDGGAIYFEGDVSGFTDISGDFIGNTADYGGAIYFNGDVSGFTGISGDFIGNTADYGGAIYFKSSVSGFMYIFGEFICNTAYRDGGAIYFNGDVSDSFIIYSIITDSIYCYGDLESIYNWFGNTASNYESKPYSTCESWLFLDASSSPLNSDGKSTVVFTLDNLYNSSSKEITHPDIPVLPDITYLQDVVFELSAVNGYLDKYSARPGESITFTSTVDKEGIVKASYGGVSYSVKIINLKLDAPDVTKDYGGPEKLEITLTGGSSPVANVDVNINLNGVDYTRKTNSDGKAYLDLNLNVGTYNAIITYQNVSTTSHITINKADLNINVSADDIAYGENLVVNIALPKDVMYRVNVSVGKFSKLVTLKNGVGSVTFSGLSLGSYVVNATYFGDKNYAKSSAITTVNVNKPGPVINVSADDITCGENLVVNLVLPSDVMYRVNVSVGKFSKLVTLKDGRGSVSFSGLSAGSYVVNATYFGDKNYGKSSAVTTVNVNKSVPSIEVSADDIACGENLVVNLILPSDVMYRVNVSVGGMSKLVTLKNGVGSVTFKGLKIGTYTVNATYSGDKNYGKSSAVTTVNVNKSVPSIEVSADDIAYGENLVVNLVLPSDVMYRVNVSVGGMSKLVTLKNGVGSVSFKGLKVGTYVVNATYSGDKKYLQNSAVTTIHVTKGTPAIGVSADSIAYGENLVVNLTAPKDIMYRVNVTVGGMTKLVTLQNGVGSVTFKGLKTGTYTVNATYSGDKNYLQNSAVTTIQVTKGTPAISVSAADVNYGENLVVNLTGSKDIMYRVNVTVGGMSKLVTLNNGVGSVSFRGLAVGSYIVNATYFGDKNYIQSSAITTANVKNANNSNETLTTIVGM